MRLAIGIPTLLLLANFISPAKTAFSSDPTSAAHKRTGCHDGYSAQYEMITFYDPKATAFEYAIITQYQKFYPDLLNYALQAHGNELISLSSDQECGWWKAASIYGQMGMNPANHRGDVY